MATFYGVNATKRDNQTIKALEAQGETNAPLKVAYDSFTLTADLAAGDVIRLMKLPAGARVHEVTFYYDDLDVSGGTVDVGWEASADAVEAADQDGFMDAVDVTTASGGVYVMSDDKPQRPGMFKQFSSEVQISVTTVGDTDATSGSIKLAVQYAIS